jgi:hypothetical protein
MAKQHAGNISSLGKSGKTAMKNRQLIFSYKFAEKRHLTIRNTLELVHNSWLATVK